MTERETGEPFIRATPNPVPFVLGLGTTTIAWSTGNGRPGWVSVLATGGAESLFAKGGQGKQEAPWIEAGVSYRFRLYGDEARTRELAEVSVAQEAPLMSERRESPFLRATPNPVPPSPGLGATTLEWATGDGTPGFVYLRQAGGGEVGVASGARGTIEAPWLQKDTAYRFRLYADQERRKQLAAVTVTMGSPTREVLLDVAVLVGAIVLLLGPVALVARLLARFRHAPVKAPLSTASSRGRWSAGPPWRPGRGAPRSARRR